MSRTTTREIISVCTELAKLDRKGKAEVLHYLRIELEKQDLEPKSKGQTWLGIETGTTTKAPTTYKEGEEK